MIVKRGDKYAVVSKSGKKMGEYDSRAEASKRLKQIEFFKMKAKKYEKCGKTPQEKPVYGPPKPPGYKYPTKEEMKEKAGEAAYLKKRKEADRVYRMTIKEGGTEAQATKAAEKILSRGSYKYGGKMMKYLKGGQIKLDANKDGKISGEDFMMLRKKK